MPFVIERLAGTINGTNRNFTISHAAIPESLIVIFTGIPLESVGSQPDQMQFAYVQNGVNITLGLAPLSGYPPPWVRYWY